ncbi:hypothetical protein P167DRAFT_384933 [Morchella conica CCBAS932]|uniref:Uncharacterized protein n=1 Tax=Morchella conica CCBAS932 TaxID=1392247 RepID=A0A3N4KZJ3_9PEZI|nr:hypothetical protein P167DRAFT_384933 [Morchella conica CCBAS932]
MPPIALIFPSLLQNANSFGYGFGNAKLLKKKDAKCSLLQALVEASAYIHGGCKTWHSEISHRMNRSLPARYYLVFTGFLLCDTCLLACEVPYINVILTI